VEHTGIELFVPTKESKDLADVFCNAFGIGFDLVHALLC